MDDQEKLDRLDEIVASVRVDVARVATMAERTDGVVTRLDEKFDHFVEHLGEYFVPRAEAAETQKNVTARLDAVETDVRDLRARSGRLPAWGSAALSIMVGIVSALLGGHYLG